MMAATAGGGGISRITTDSVMAGVVALIELLFGEGTERDLAQEVPGAGGMAEGGDTAKLPACLIAVVLSKTTTTGQVGRTHVVFSVLWYVKYSISLPSNGPPSQEEVDARPSYCQQLLEVWPDGSTG